MVLLLLVLLGSHAWCKRAWHDNSYGMAWVSGGVALAEKALFSSCHVLFGDNVATMMFIAFDIYLFAPAISALPTATIPTDNAHLKIRLHSNSKPELHLSGGKHSRGPKSSFQGQISHPEKCDNSRRIWSCNSHWKICVHR